MRREGSNAENVLWYFLLNRQLGGMKFRRQHPIGNYIVDFICIEAMLIIEADGGQHCDNRYDEARTAWLEKQGYHVLRFWNNEILQNREGVLQMILDAALERVGKKS